MSLRVINLHQLVQIFMGEIVTAQPKRKAP